MKYIFNGKRQQRDITTLDFCYSETVQQKMDVDGEVSDSERLISLYPELDPEPDTLFPYVRSLDNSSVRCVCQIPYDDGATIQCDGCFVWQHMVCMAIDRRHIPNSYYCEACVPRRVDVEVFLLFYLPDSRCIGMASMALSFTLIEYGLKTYCEI